MIIDRFEENFAVCEIDKGNFVDIERSLIPQHAKEGDFLIKQGDKYIIDEKSTQLKRKQIQQKQDLLWE